MKADSKGRQRTHPPSWKGGNVRGSRIEKRYGYKKRSR